MDSDLYRAAANGKIDAFKENNELQLEKLLTPDKNTVLHVHLTASTKDNETSFVEEILNLKQGSLLLMQPNARGDIPLHVAARYGHERIAKLLIERVKTEHDNIESGKSAAKEMLRTTNEQNDTSLHEAVRFNHPQVAKILIEEDPDFSYSANKYGETPLYIAAEREYLELLSLIVDKCSSPAFDGPYRRTALHGAAIRGSGVIKILEKMGHLTKQADHRGWVPLHFAVHLNYFNMVKKVLLRPEYKDTAYIKNLKGRTPLHIAASHGYHEMMTEILSCCPDCGELVDNEGWNALHFAVKSNKILAVKVILNDSSLSNLLNGRDKDGNTPLHIATSLGHTKILRALVSFPRVDKMAYNNKNQNAFDVALRTSKNRGRLFNSLMKEEVPRGNRIWIYEDEDDLKEIEENDIDIDKIKEPTMIVATLIATITFAAGFTLPGGYVNEQGPFQGTAILRQNAAFQAFMVTDTIAMVLSTFSVLIQLFLTLRQDERTKLNYHSTAHALTMLALGAMVIAFVTGTYAVLAPSAALAIATCVTGLSFFVFFYVIFRDSFGVF